MSLYLQLTYNCNLRCRHCYLSSRLGHSEEFHFTNEILAFLGRHKAINRVVIHGGEPVMAGFEKVKDLIKALPPDKRVSFQTNLIAIPERLLDSWADLFLKHTGGRIGTSMDVYRSDWFDFWRERVIGLIEKGVKITVLVTLAEGNTSFYWKLFDFCIKNGIRIKFQFEYRPSYSKSYTEKIRSLTDWLFERAVSVYSKSETLYKMFSISKKVCTDTFTVSPDGYLYMCPTLSWSDKFRIGHISDQYLRIDDSDPYKYLIAYYKYAASVCDKDCWNECFGGCPATVLYGFFRGIKRLDSYCDIKKRLIRRIRDVSCS